MELEVSDEFQLLTVGGTECVVARPIHIAQWQTHYLDKTDILGVFSERLTAEVDAVLADQTGTVGGDAALTRTLTVAARAREPDVFVRHSCNLFSVLKV